MCLPLKVLTLCGVIVLSNYCLSVDVAIATYGSRTVLGEKEYYVGTTQKVNWYRAAQICSAIGMTLTSIESETEYTNLNNHLFYKGLLGEQFWLFGTDLALSGEYIWLSSGNKMSYAKWATGQPTATNRCVRTNAAFLWETANCADSNYFICSRPTLPSCGTTGRCSYSFQQYGLVAQPTN